MEREATLTGADLIAAERERQVSEEGWTPEHDDTHDSGEMAAAAAAYAWPRDLRTRDNRGVHRSTLWPWPDGFHHHLPRERVRELVKAGALIAAEIDRLQRAPSPEAGE